MAENMIPCAICGAPIVKYRNSKYCPKCSEEAKKQQHREYNRRYRERQKKKGQDKKQPKIDWNDQQCKDCKYGLYLKAHGHYVCDYLDQTGHTRPCKGGPECTVREARKG